jgi:hypothetical protein
VSPFLSMAFVIVFIRAWIEWFIPKEDVDADFTVDVATVDPGVPPSLGPAAVVTGSPVPLVPGLQGDEPWLGPGTDRDPAFWRDHADKHFLRGQRVAARVRSTAPPADVRKGR